MAASFITNVPTWFRPCDTAEETMAGGGIEGVMGFRSQMTLSDHVFGRFSEGLVHGLLSFADFATGCWVLFFFVGLMVSPRDSLMILARMTRMTVLWSCFQCWGRFVVVPEQKHHDVLFASLSSVYFFGYIFASLSERFLRWLQRFSVFAWCIFLVWRWSFPREFAHLLPSRSMSRWTF